MELRPKPFYYTNLCYDINFVKIVPNLYIITNHYESAYNGKCVRNKTLISSVVWNLITFLSNVMNGIVPSPNKMIVLIHLAFAHFGLIEVPNEVKTPEDLENYKRAVKLIGSMTEFNIEVLNEAELIAYPYVKKCTNATVFAFSYLNTLNSRINYMANNDYFNLDKHSIVTIGEVLDKLDKQAKINLYWIYFKLQSHVVFPYFATFWINGKDIVEQNNLYNVYLTTHPTPFNYWEDFVAIFSRPCENSVRLMPTDNVSYESKTFLKYPFNFLKQLIKQIDTNENIEKYSIYETHIVQQIGWKEDLDKTIMAMNDIVYNTPHKIGPIELLCPNAPKKPIPFKRRIIFDSTPSKKLKFDDDSTDGDAPCEIDIAPLFKEVPNEECIKYNDLSEEAREILEKLSFKVVDISTMKQLGFK